MSVFDVDSSFELNKGMAFGNVIIEEIQKDFVRIWFTEDSKRADLINEDTIKEFLKTPYPRILFDYFNVEKIAVGWLVCHIRKTDDEIVYDWC